MTLQELWDQLVEKADPSLTNAISFFTPQVHSLSDELPDYEHHEFPKWVDGKLVQSAAEEAALKAPAEAPVAEAAEAPKPAGA